MSTRQCKPGEANVLIYSRMMEENGRVRYAENGRLAEDVTKQ